MSITNMHQPSIPSLSRHDSKGRNTSDSLSLLLALSMAIPFQGHTYDSNWICFLPVSPLALKRDSTNQQIHNEEET